MHLLLACILYSLPLSTSYVVIDTFTLTNPLGPSSHTRVVNIIVREVSYLQCPSSETSHLDSSEYVSKKLQLCTLIIVPVKIAVSVSSISFKETSTFQWTPTILHCSSLSKSRKCDLQRYVFHKIESSFSHKNTNV